MSVQRAFAEGGRSSAGSGCVLSQQCNSIEPLVAIGPCQSLSMNSVKRTIRKCEPKEDHLDHMVGLSKCACAPRWVRKRSTSSKVQRTALLKGAHHFLQLACRRRRRLWVRPREVDATGGAGCRYALGPGFAFGILTCVRPTSHSSARLAAQLPLTSDHIRRNLSQLLLLAPKP
eukprot:1193278-Prorocentrum_minimum.AAC.2